MHVAVAVKQLHVTSLMGEAEEEFKKEMSLMAVRRASIHTSIHTSITPPFTPDGCAPRRLHSHLHSQLHSHLHSHLLR